MICPTRRYFTYESAWQRVGESKPLRAFRDFAQFQHKTTAVCALYDSVQIARFAESRTITQLQCPNLSEKPWRAYVLTEPENDVSRAAKHSFYTHARGMVGLNVLGSRRTRNQRSRGDSSVNHRR